MGHWSELSIFDDSDDGRKLDFRSRSLQCLAATASSHIRNWISAIVFDAHTHKLLHNALQCYRSTFELLACSIHKGPRHSGRRANVALALIDRPFDLCCVMTRARRARQKQRNRRPLDQSFVCVCLKAQLVRCRKDARIRVGVAQIM